MSINTKLAAFAQYELVLSHNDTEREKIKASVGQLEKILKDKLGNNIKEFVRFGSFTRNTILPRQYDPNSDVDLMVVFNTSVERKTAGTYRKWILDVVSEAYPNSVSKKDFPAVKLLLNHIMFDIVPAYCDEFGWTNTKYYYIPDSRDGWRSTTPNDINDDLARKNQSVGNNIVRNTVRLCKCWNASEAYPFESYLMEKEIINTFFFWGGDLREKFVHTLESIAGGRAGVKQAIEYIRRYEREGNEQREFEWFQRLLPGLK